MTEQWQSYCDEGNHFVSEEDIELEKLEKIPDKHIHFPHTYLAATGQSEHCYWPAIVDHKAARARALDAFKV